MKRQTYLFVPLSAVIDAAVILCTQAAWSLGDPEHDLAEYCEHIPSDCEGQDLTFLGKTEQSNSLPQATGQDMFAALPEINGMLEWATVNWAFVDMDALWAHVRDMDALMTGAVITKIRLVNGIKMQISGVGATKSAMDQMLPRHRMFLASARPSWKIDLDKIEEGYLLTVTSEAPEHAERPWALGFSGFIVYDDHREAHHLSLARVDRMHRTLCGLVAYASK